MQTYWFNKVIIKLGYVVLYVASVNVSMAQDLIAHLVSTNKPDMNTNNQCLSIDSFVSHGAPGLIFDTTLEEYFIDCNDSYEDNCNCCVTVPPSSIDNVRVPTSFNDSNTWKKHGITRNIACNLNHLSGIPISTRFVVAFCNC